MDEEFPYQQKLVPLLSAQKKELGGSSPFALQLPLKRVSSFLGERKYRISTRNKISAE
jgi:hypothetical protein